MPAELTLAELRQRWNEVLDLVESRDRVVVSSLDVQPTTCGMRGDGEGANLRSEPLGRMCKLRTGRSRNSRKDRRC